MTGDPLTNIEERQAQLDLGAVAHRLYRGARDDGASRRVALGVVAAWFWGMTHDMSEGEDD